MFVVSGKKKWRELSGFFFLRIIEGISGKWNNVHIIVIFAKTKNWELR